MWRERWVKLDRLLSIEVQIYDEMKRRLEPAHRSGKSNRYKTKMVNYFVRSRKINIYEVDNYECVQIVHYIISPCKIVAQSV